MAQRAPGVSLSPSQVTSCAQQAPEEPGRGEFTLVDPSRDFPRAEAWAGLQLRKMKVTRRWTGLTADCPFLTAPMLQWEQGAIPCEAQGGQG